MEQVVLAQDLQALLVQPQVYLVVHIDILQVGVVQVIVLFPHQDNQVVLVVVGTAVNQAVRPQMEQIIPAAAAEVVQQLPQRQAVVEVVVQAW